MEPIPCAECGTPLAEGQDRQEADGKTFCRSCFERLTHELGQALAQQGQDINYPLALLGGLGGAALGILAWWGFTVMTSIAFGLVAVVIGIAVGKGVTLLAGGKRHLNLQILSVVIALVGFAYATYLVNRTFIERAVVQEGEQIVLPWLPPVGLFFEVVRLDFGIMDVVFLAIVAWEAWKIPGPLTLPRAS